MARPRYPKHEGPLPPPLPHETRTIGQLVAETVRLYGERFWRVVPIGLSVAALDAASFGRDANVQTLVLWAFSPLVTASYVAGSALAADVKPRPRDAVRAFAVGLLVFVPFPVLFRIFVLPSLALLALLGLAVPAAVVERLPAATALRRGAALGRADFTHALGSLCTLALVYFLTRTVLLLLLRSQGDATELVAGFLADVVLSPILFLGAGLLYFDQAARVGLSRRARAVRSSAHGR